MAIMEDIQKSGVQETSGKHAGSYRTKYAGNYSAVAQAKQESGACVLNRKTQTGQKFGRLNKVALLDMIADLEEEVEELKKQVYISCVAQANVLFRLMCSVSHCCCSGSSK